VEHFIIPLDCAQDFLAQRVLMFWSLMTFLNTKSAWSRAFGQQQEHPQIII